MQKKKRKSKSSLIDKSVLFLNLLAVLGLLLSYIAPVVRPQVCWPIAFFGISYLIWFVLNGVFVLFWLFKKSVFALLSLLVLLLGFNAFKKHVGFSNTVLQEIRDASSSDLRLFSYNIHAFRTSDEGKDFETIEKITQLIDSVSPDVVCLQEFHTRNKGKFKTLTQLKKVLKLPYQYYFPIIKNDFESYGLIILSKYVIKNTGVVSAGTAAHALNRSIYADVQLPNGEMMRIYNVHLQSIGFNSEDYKFIDGASKAPLQQDLKSSKKILIRLKNAFQQREIQVDLLTNSMKNCPTKYYTVAGDFNDTPLSFAVNQVGKNMHNSFVEKGNGWVKTYHGNFPNFQIDYIFSSMPFQVKSYQTVKVNYSDHYPIWSDLKPLENNE